MSKAVIGLGNPGAEYARTRHNVGFLVVELLASRLRIRLCQSSYGAVWGNARFHGEILLLAKPQGFMNRSGEVVDQLRAAWDLELTGILIVHDDLDLELGRIQLKRGGGTAGHRGLASIVEQLGSPDFPRLRIGVGRPAEKSAAVDFVLEEFTPSERDVVDPAIERAQDGALAWVTAGLDAAMARFNVRPGDA